MLKSTLPRQADELWRRRAKITVGVTGYSKRQGVGIPPVCVAAGGGGSRHVVSLDIDVLMYAELLATVAVESGLRQESLGREEGM